MKILWKTFAMVLAVAWASHDALAQIDGSLVPRRAAPRTVAPAQWIPTAIPQGLMANPAVGNSVNTSQAETAQSAPRDSKVVQTVATQATLSKSEKQVLRAKVTSGDGKLPNDQGQVWREYDISPYTLRVASTNRPEQSIIDWILRDTGYEAWHGDAVSVLHADNRTLKVYHTPEMQARVGDIADRFVNSEAESHALSLRIITVGHPNWRAKAHRMLHPVPTQAQGTQAWVLEKEDAALLVAEISRRIDFREHGSPEMLVHNGQSATVASLRPHTYTKDVTVRTDRWPVFTPEVAQLDEGFSLELSPLLSLDGETIDAAVKCNIDQLEKMVATTLEVPGGAGPRQRTKIETPQMSHCRLHERFHWPAGKVLLVDFGVVATPSPTDSPLNLSIPLASGPSRANFLVFIESRGSVENAPAAASDAPAVRQAATFRQRY